MSGDLNGQALRCASLVMPRWGIWWADVQTVEADPLSGAVTLTLGGLVLKGTIVDGDVYRSAGWYRVVGGAAGWRTVIAPKGYRNQAGVQLRTVVQDAAALCGETLGTWPSTPVGPAFSRPKDAASRVLELEAEENWHVDNDGITQFGTRAPAAFGLDYSVINRHSSGRMLTVAAEDISTLVPGAQLEEVEVSSVRHELTPTMMRSHVWALVDGDQQSEDLKALIRHYTAHYDFAQRPEYRVTKAGSGYLDLRPMRPTSGFPDLANVPQRTGIPGGGGDPQVGSSVLVGFVGGDPTRPYVCDYDGEAGSGWLPTEIRIDTAGRLKAGASAAVVELAGGAQFLSLANLVDTNLSSIKTDLTTIAAAAGSSSAYTPSSVAASKVKGT